MDRSRSQALFEEAQRVIPGGVNSPVRAFRGVGGTPVFFQSGRGATITDADGNTYLDYVGSWGPLILGHAHPAVLSAITEAAARGTTFGAPTELEVRFAEAVQARVPSMEKLRCVSSGTEATMSALRLARGFTGRDKIIKIDGAYHGHADFLLVAAGSGAATLGLPGSAGVPAGAVKDTLVIPFNDLPALDEALAAHGADVAALIVEPVCGNMGLVPPAPGYLEGLRERCDRSGALLIFDEVMTGFRVHPGSAQGRYGVRPDLSTFGKVVGGGLPAAVFGGRAEVMNVLAPLGPVYQAGTLSGNPVAMAAGLKVMELLVPAVYEHLEAMSARLEAGLVSAARAAGVPLTVNRCGSMITAFFTDGPVVDYGTAKRSDLPRFARFFHALLDGGVYFPPSQFEAAFLSHAHGPAEIDRTLEVAARALSEVR